MRIAILLAVLLSGCGTLADRASTQPERHPCGNVWDICKGDSVILDRVAVILEGR